MAPPKKSKTQDNLNSRLTLVMKSGKYHLGYKTVLKSLRNGKAKMIIIAGNCRGVNRSEIEYYAMLAGADVVKFGGNNCDLGTACGRLFPVSVLSVTDGGDSDLLTKK